LVDSVIDRRQARYDSFHKAFADMARNLDTELRRMAPEYDGQSKDVLIPSQEGKVHE
jgi:hypothetical protein